MKCESRDEMASLAATQSPPFPRNARAPISSICSCALLLLLLPPLVLSVVALVPYVGGRRNSAATVSPITTTTLALCTPHERIHAS